MGLNAQRGGGALSIRDITNPAESRVPKILPDPRLRSYRF